MWFIRAKEDKLGLSLVSFCEPDGMTNKDNRKILKEVGEGNKSTRPLSLYPCLFPVVGTFLVFITSKVEKNPNELIFIAIKICMGDCIC